MSTFRSELDYYASQQCAPQWRSFLLSLAEELSEQLDITELRQLMRALGRRVAAKLPLARVATLEELAASANEVWRELHFGWVECREQDGFLQLIHHADPLAAAFGDRADAWAPALLEGVYEEWLRNAGADQRLRLYQQGERTQRNQPLEFRLSLA